MALLIHVHMAVRVGGRAPAPLGELLQASPERRWLHLSRHLHSPWLRTVPQACCGVDQRWQNASLILHFVWQIKPPVSCQITTKSKGPSLYLHVPAQMTGTDADVSVHPCLVTTRQPVPSKTMPGKTPWIKSGPHGPKLFLPSV